MVAETLFIPECNENRLYTFAAQIYKEIYGKEAKGGTRNALLAYNKRRGKIKHTTDGVHCRKVVAMQEAVRRSGELSPTYQKYLPK